MGKNNIKKDPFFLQLDNYKRDFLPLYQKLGLTPKQLFQTSIKLPFHIPFEEGTCISFIHSDNSIVTLIFYSTSIIQKYGPGLLTEESFDVTIKSSIVELVFLVEQDFPSLVVENDELASFHIDICLEYLNYVIVSYLVTTKDFSVFRVTTRMFEILSLFKYVNIDDWASEMSSLFFHHDVPYIKDVVNKDVNEKIVHFANVINKENNPFIFPEELLLNSKRNAAKGFYKEAIISTQTSFETFIKTLLLEIYNSEKMELEIIEKKFEKGFLNIIKKECHLKIGGIWDITLVNSPLWHWYNKCYVIRNKIIHSGYIPNYAETISAIDSIILTRDYILTLLKAKRKIYPKIFEYILLSNKNS